MTLPSAQTAASAPGAGIRGAAAVVATSLMLRLARREWARCGLPA